MASRSRKSARTASARSWSRRRDRIIKVNGRVVRDYLDFRFQTAGETELLIEVRKKSGDDWEVELERAENEDFGSVSSRSCRASARTRASSVSATEIPRMRGRHFIKDEDVRLSFLYGNYTTLTSITEDEIRRIIEQRLSPQYVSVHATDLEVRAYLLGVDKKRADIWATVQRLLAGIEIHAQVVLCPGINDGEVLRKTIFDLAAEYPRITSRDRAARFDSLQYRRAAYCCYAGVLSCGDRSGCGDPETACAQLGTNLLGDEIYLRAAAAFPRDHTTATIRRSKTVSGWFARLRTTSRVTKRLERADHVNKKAATIFTGTLFAPVLREMIDKWNSRFETRLRVEPLENTYFGGDVSVAGFVDRARFAGGP